MADALGTEIENARAVGYLHTDKDMIPFANSGDLNLIMYEFLESRIIAGNRPENGFMLHATLFPTKDSSPINLEPYRGRFKVGMFGDFEIENTHLLVPSERDGDTILYYVLNTGKNIESSIECSRGVAI